MENKPTMEDKFDEIMLMLQDMEIKLRKKAEEKEMLSLSHNKKRISKKKNHHLHILVDKELYGRLNLESDEKKVSLAEYCRVRLEEDSQLNRIENKINLLLKKNE